jgi:hypothetical protein
MYSETLATVRETLEIHSWKSERHSRTRKHTKKLGKNSGNTKPSQRSTKCTCERKWKEGFKEMSTEKRLIYKWFNGLDCYFWRRLIWIVDLRRTIRLSTSWPLDLEIDCGIRWKHRHSSNYFPSLTLRPLLLIRLQLHPFIFSCIRSSSTASIRVGSCCVPRRVSWVPMRSRRVHIKVP